MRILHCAILAVGLWSSYSFSYTEVSSAAAAGRGGTVSSGTDDILVNPALPGSEIRYSLSGGYAFHPLYSSPFVSVAFPFSGAVMSAAYERLNYSDLTLSRDTATLGFSKEIYPLFRGGISVDYSSLRGDLSGGFIGGSVGFFWDIPYYSSRYSDLGFFDPFFSVSGRFGSSWGKNSKEYVDLRMVSSTAGFTLIRTASTKTIMSVRGDYSFADKGYPIGAGLEEIISNSFILRGGLMFDGDAAYDGFSLGSGLRYDGESFVTSLDYAFTHTGDGNAHIISATIKYGTVDKEPPLVKVYPRPSYISPNFDGINDYSILDITVEDRSKIKGWKMVFAGQDGTPVKEYRSSEREIDEGFGVASFFGHVFSSKSSYSVPSRILWDGTDSKGKLMPDGAYSYYFMAWDENDNYSVKESGVIIVDTTPPAAEISATDILFSPNGDRNKDELIIRQKVTGGKDDLWRGSFVDASGLPVRSFQWKTDDLPSTLKWDGKTDDGADAPEGLYRYVLSSSDPSGNSYVSDIREISLVRSYESADVLSNARYYSYQKSAPIVFSAYLSRTAGLKTWNLSVEDAKGRAVKSFSGTALPAGISWDGLDEKGKRLDDGEYFYRFSSEFESGNTPSSYKKSLIIDSTPPSTALKFDPSIFSPDGDGENDLLKLHPRADDEFGIDRWEILIHNRTGYLFRKFTGSGTPPSEIVWDGFGLNNELVESAEDYTMDLLAVDKSGNSSSVKGVRLPVDILVVVTERGLKIKISNIEFAFGSDRMLGKAEQILNRVADILEKYSAYSVVVEGHTDDIGEDNYNLRLSETRAKAVYEYLINKGIDKERLSFRGMGETVPYAPNKDEESRRKNRRVEFLLEKKQAQ